MAISLLQSYFISNVVLLGYYCNYLAILKPLLLQLNKSYETNKAMKQSWNCKSFLND